MKGPAATKTIGNIHGNKGFQGGCYRLRAVLFAANGTTPNLSPTFITVTGPDIVDYFTDVTSEKIVTPYAIVAALYGTSLSSAPGADNMPCPIVAACYKAIPTTQAEIYSTLLKYGIHPGAWKIAKCTLIPKPRKKEIDNDKSYRPILRPSCIRETLQKVAAARMAKYGIRVGAIDNTQTGPKTGRFVQDALMHQLTSGHELLSRSKYTYKKVATQPVLRPTILANNINRAFNTVRHKRVNDVMSIYGLHQYIVNWTKNFCTNRTLCFHFQDEIEIPLVFNSALPQGSPLSPILFVIYTTTTITKPTRKTEVKSMYVDDDIMRQGSTTEIKVTLKLQQSLDEQHEKAKPLGLQYSPDKADLIHLYPTSSSSLPTTPRIVKLGDTRITSGEAIRLRGTTFDKKSTPREQTAAAASKTRQPPRHPQRLAFSWGASMQSLHHLGTSLLYPALI